MFNLMRIKDFAKELKVPESTVYTWKLRGDIPIECFKRIGGSWFVRVEETQKWMAS